MSVHENDCFKRMENTVLNPSYPNPAHSHRNPSLDFFLSKTSVEKQDEYGSLIRENAGLAYPFVRTIRSRENDVLPQCA